jgi:hypothetical protein
MSDEIREIGCINGFYQGDVIATWGYIIATQPLLNFIKGKLRQLHPAEVHMVKFYVDDGNFVEYGYKLKKNEGCNLMGSSETMKLLIRDSVCL